MEITTVSFRGDINHQAVTQTRGYQKLNSHITAQHTTTPQGDHFIQKSAKPAETKKPAPPSKEEKPAKKKRGFFGKVARVVTAPVRLIYHNPLPALAVGGTLMGGYYLAIPALYKAFNEQKAINATNDQLRKMKIASKAESLKQSARPAVTSKVNTSTTHATKLNDNISAQKKVVRSVTTQQGELTPRNKIQ